MRSASTYAASALEPRLSTVLFGVALAVVVGLALCIGPLTAQSKTWPEADAEVGVYAYKLEHQPAGEAMPLIYPLLSATGTVEVQPSENTLIVRDRGAVLRQLLPILQQFDRPAEPLRLKIQVVRAGSRPARAVGTHTLPPRLLERLRELLRYQNYSVQASAQLDTQEGERVTYELGDEFRIELRLGTVSTEDRLRLYGVRLFRRASAGAELSELIHTNLSLELGEPFLLGLAKSETSPDALMLVFTTDRAKERRPMVAN